MKSRYCLALGCVLFAVFAATSASAQSSGPSVRGYGVVGSTFLKSDRTFEAVAGESHQVSIGGGVQLVNVWKSLFADLSVTQTRVEGERVYIDGGTVYSLGIPLRVTLRPIDVAAGWRVQQGRRVSPYIGGGLSHLIYRETSDFAEAADDVKDNATGPLLLWGVDVEAVRWLHVGGEMRYRIVRGILGERGASAELGDHHIGGLAGSVRVSVGP